MHSPPLLGKLMIDKLEAIHGKDGNGQRWDVSGWYGSQLNRVWLKSEGDRNDNTTESASLEALASHAIAPFWDAQIGLRHDFASNGMPERDWAAIGIKGIAPYWFELEATAYVGNHSRSALSLKASYELRITQKVLLEPEIETRAYGRDDMERNIGKGLASADAGLRLRYEIHRQFAPYVGVSHTWLFGNTNALAPIGATTEWLAGLRLWY